MLHKLLDSSLGAQGAFAPDLVPRNREPADVAWSAGERIILFYCKGGNKDRLKKDEKNFAQAKGWMRKWNGGARLKGQSSSHRFDIKHSDVKDVCIVLLSSSAESNWIFCPSDKFIDGCKIFSLTEDFLFRFLELSPNFDDLIQLLEDLQKTSYSGSARYFGIESIVKTIFSNAYFSVYRDAKLPFGDTKDYTFEVIREMKATIQLKYGNEAINLSYADIACICGISLANSQIVTKEFCDNNRFFYNINRQIIRGRKIITAHCVDLLRVGDLLPKLEADIRGENYFIAIFHWPTTDFPGAWQAMILNNLGTELRS